MIELALAASLLAAQPVATDCANAITQQAMNRCAAEGAQAAEEDMKRAAQQVMRQIAAQAGGENGEGARRLRDAQRTWLAYRDAQCALAGIEAMGGTLEPLLVAGCLKDMNERRAVDLMMMVR